MQKIALLHLSDGRGCIIADVLVHHKFCMQAVVQLGNQAGNSMKGMPKVLEYLAALELAKFS